jgi:para-nitrobenzyl esterase
MPALPDEIDSVTAHREHKGNAASSQPAWAHTLELQYIFPGYHGAAGVKKPLSAHQQMLPNAMIKYWTDFAGTGNPNGKGLPNWPQWTRATEQS